MAQKWSDKYPNGLQREKSSPSFPQHLILKEEKNDWNKLCPCNYTVTTNKTINLIKYDKHKPLLSKASSVVNTKLVAATCTHMQKIMFSCYPTFAECTSLSMC